ncbi:hypothetical protein CVT25_010414 [Psilocybe cyanescens]|uniref:Uncharacterized protein n=1 Tax=Psilocybe cyanescens TaxID=93625 RepID=A0A409X2Q0_PSICY|nr:hypothetical protein CVT25_010414 [Psilocybe cyanescens]
MAHARHREVMLAPLRRNERNMTSLLATAATRRQLLNFIADTQRLRSVFGHIAQLNLDDDS